MPQATQDLTDPSPPTQSRIFELPIELGHPDELLQRIVGWVGGDEPTKRVMYVNAHVLNQSREDPALREALEGADLVYCDGYGVRLAAKALSAEIPHRMTGADWIWDLAALCEQQDRSVYLLGCDPGVAAQAGQRLRRAHPGPARRRHPPRLLPDRLRATTSASSRTSTRASPTSCSSAWERPSRRSGRTARSTA